MLTGIANCEQVTYVQKCIMPFLPERQRDCWLSLPVKNMMGFYFGSVTNGIISFTITNPD